MKIQFFEVYKDGKVNNNTMKDYHDYVIKDGKLIGEFDKMYADCDDPWHQSREAR